MMKKLSTLVASAALLAVAGTAHAGQPLPLSDRQMDGVTAGATALANTAAAAFGELFAWVSDSNWRDGGKYNRPGGASPYRPATEQGPAQSLGTAFGLSKDEVAEFTLYLRDWKKHRLSSAGKGRISFVGDFYRILDTLGIWKLQPTTCLSSRKQNQPISFSSVSGTRDTQSRDWGRLRPRRH